MTTINDKLYKIIDDIGVMLVEKNKAYGNSALDPVRVFSKAATTEQILVRLDDKLSRLARGSAAGEDVEKDLLGYLIILWVSRSKTKDFTEAVLETNDRFSSYISAYTGAWRIGKYSFFSKASRADRLRVELDEAIASCAENRCPEAELKIMALLVHLRAEVESQSEPAAIGPKEVIAPTEDGQGKRMLRVGDRVRVARILCDGDCDGDWATNASRLRATLAQLDATGRIVAIHYSHGLFADVSYDRGSGICVPHDMKELELA